jgi:hypothetical protein
MKYRPEVISIFESPVLWALIPLISLAISPSIDDIARGNGRLLVNLAEIFGGLTAGYAVLMAAANQKGPLYFSRLIIGPKINRWLTPQECAAIRIEKKEVIALAKGAFDQMQDLRSKHAEKLSRKS